MLGLSVITKITYSYYDITITHSICVQYSYATVDLILMAVAQEDIEHWKETAPHTYTLRYVEHLLTQYAYKQKIWLEKYLVKSTKITLAN